jgi:hypothetical protein
MCFPGFKVCFQMQLVPLHRELRARSGARARVPVRHRIHRGSVGTPLPGVRLVTWTILAVTWTILAVIDWCVLPYALLGWSLPAVSDWLHGPYWLSSIGVLTAKYGKVTKVPTLHRGGARAAARAAGGDARRRRARREGAERVDSIHLTHSLKPPGSNP